MDLLALIACLALALLCAYLLVLPHLYSKPTTTEITGATTLNLLDQKERCLQVLKDLELDFVTGKLEETEYTKMKAVVSSELAGILAAIDDQTEKS